MKKIAFAILAVLATAAAAQAQVHVKGHYRSNGTYVEPHIRSAPDGNPYNNYGGN